MLSKLQMGKAVCGYSPENYDFQCAHSTANMCGRGLIAHLSMIGCLQHKMGKH